MYRMLVLASFLLLAGEARADQRDAERCAKVAMWDAFAEGWNTHALRGGALDAGGATNFAITLKGGVEYAFHGCGDAGLSRVDVMLYDSDGHVVARDYGGGREASFQFKPSVSRTYFLVMYAHGSDRKPEASHVAMAVTWR